MFSQYKTVNIYVTFDSVSQELPIQVHYFSILKFCCLVTNNVTQIHFKSRTVDEYNEYLEYILARLLWCHLLYYYTNW